MRVCLYVDGVGRVTGDLKVLKNEDLNQYLSSWKRLYPHTFISLRNAKFNNPATYNTIKELPIAISHISMGYEL